MLEVLFCWNLSAEDIDWKISKQDKLTVLMGKSLFRQSQTLYVKSQMPTFDKNELTALLNLSTYTFLLWAVVICLSELSLVKVCRATMWGTWRMLAEIFTSLSLWLWTVPLHLILQQFKCSVYILKMSYTDMVHMLDNLTFSVSSWWGCQTNDVAKPPEKKKSLH